MDKLGFTSIKCLIISLNNFTIWFFYLFNDL